MLPMKNIIVFDIETRNSFAEVDNDFKKLKISVVSLYSYLDGEYRSFVQEEFKQLWPILEKADLLIGYNSEHFDVPILNNYYLGDLSVIPHLDLLKVIKQSLGIRLKLDDVAKATLDNVSKSANGLQAIRWWKDGQIEEIKKYCEKDVEVTKQVYEFGKKHKQLFYKNFSGDSIPFAVDFETIDRTNKTDNINLSLPI